MKPTKGNLLIRRNDDTDDLILDGFEKGCAVASVCTWGDEQRQADSMLLAKGWNAAQEINPDNPIAAAEAMPEIWRLMREVAGASQRICPPFDSERWLREVEEIVLKAITRD